jgi:hypothetical protein
VGYDKIITTKKSSSASLTNDADRALCRQLDELERVSLAQRDKHLGRDYFREVKEFYSLDDDIGNFPSFRPRVRIPKLQTLVLNEATDITDSSPKIFIATEGKRDEAREKYYQANWRQGCYNNRILFATINAMLTNLGWLQVGFQPNARRGKGRTWLESRDPETVAPDPFSTSEADWSWVQWWDWMYIDDVRRQWPEHGRFVRPRVYQSGDADPYGLQEGSLEFPEYSPLSQQGESPQTKIFRSNRVRVRHTYLFDNTRQKVEENLGSKAISRLLVHPRFEYTYPDGRWITDCEQIILADGNNWCPQLPDDDRGTFPLVRLSAMPTLHNIWGPPPIKLTRDLQNLSERLYAQFTENIIRTNNGVIVLETNCGLDPQAIGWLPGEILMINPNSKPPVVLNPQSLPQHMMTFPASLLALQDELQGFSKGRQGQQGAGNISPDLFDASLWQSQYQTRLRARLLAESLQRLAQIVFYVDARYKGIADKMAVPDKGDLSYVEWSPIANYSDYDAFLDEGSLRVMSASAMRSVVAALGKAGMLPTSAVLEAADIPNASELAEQKNRELELAAMAKIKRPR